MNPLTLTNISKAFASQQVLDNISLSLNERDIFGLIGLNGIGKTTLIKILLGLLKADSGGVSIFDEMGTKSRRHICYLPEKFSPSPYITGFEFIEYALSYHKVKSPKNIVEEMAINLDLDPKSLSHKVGKYSKGMGQKIGLIATMLSNARLLILDEPMSGLDPRSRVMLKNQLKLFQQNGGTIFFTSHILADIEEICSRIAILHDRQITFDGTPAAFMTGSTKSLEERFLEKISV